MLLSVDVCVVAHTSTPKPSLTVVCAMCRDRVDCSGVCLAEQNQFRLFVLLLSVLHLQEGTNWSVEVTRLFGQSCTSDNTTMTM